MLTYADYDDRGNDEPSDCAVLASQSDPNQSLSRSAIEAYIHVNTSASVHR